MDVRYKAHLIAEAGAVHRQEMARVAQSVAAGFSDKAGFTGFITSLELYESKAMTEGDEKLANKVMDKLRKRK